MDWSETIPIKTRLRVPMKCRLVISLLCGLFSTSSYTSDVLHIPHVGRDKEALSYEVLKLALEKSNVTSQLRQADPSYNNARLITEVEAGNIDVIWAGASPDKDQRLKAIRVPILKGLVGYKLLIIRGQDQSAFDRINSLEALKRYQAGQKFSWADTKILLDAGVPTVTSIRYPNLFKMLEGGRFDYFPRGVLDDPWQEVNNHAHLNLKVEDRLILAYPHALYFYVNKDNDTLYRQIHDGFESAIKDGSFNELFFSNQWVKSIIERSDLKHRTILKIDNVLMHEDTPYDRSDYWLDSSLL